MLGCRHALILTPSVCRLFLLLGVDECIRFNLATDAVAAVLGTMNEHTFVNIVVFSDEVSPKRKSRACLALASCPILQ